MTMRTSTAWGAAIATVMCTVLASADPNKSASLDPLLESLLVATKVPALAAAVVRGGETVAIGAAGVRKEGSPERVTVQDRWHIGSCTKSMTAALAAMLVEAGDFRWDMTLPEMFPGLAREMNAGWRGATLEELLTHHAGVPHELDENGLWDRLWDRTLKPPQEQRDYLTRELLTQQGPVSQPGEGYVYANAGYALVGHAIEMKLDRPWEDALRQLLCKPLGMDSVGFGPPGTTGQVDQPWGHKVEADGRLRPIPPGPDVDNPAAIGPGGSVHCSIGDLATYAAWQVRGAQGKGTLLRPETFRRLHTPFGRRDYACGWRVTRRSWGGGEVLTHGGSNTMFYSVIWLAPIKDFAVVVCTNVGGDVGTHATDATAWALIQKYLPESTR